MNTKINETYSLEEELAVYGVIARAHLTLTLSFNFHSVFLVQDQSAMGVPKVG